MRTKIIIIFLVFLLLVFSVSAIRVEEAECYDDGSSKIILKANSEKYVYTNDIVVTADDKRVKGNWDGTELTLTNPSSKRATFLGQENRLVEKKVYSMRLNFKERIGDSVEDAELTFDLECPGLSFTCKRLGIKINDCLTSKREKFTANLEIYGLEQSPTEKLDPLKVIDYLLEAQILYKDINGYTSKSGSLPKGAVVTKTADNRYLVEAHFDKYSTNNVKTMFVKFNDNLPRACNPSDYSSLVLSYKKSCEYRETEEDLLEEQKEKEEQESLVLGSMPKGFEETPIGQLKDEVYNEISELEIKKSEIESRLNELYEQRSGLASTDNEDDSKSTGYSVKDSEDSSKKKERLKILFFFLLGVMIVGGVLLSYLYKEGYFY